MADSRPKVALVKGSESYDAVSRALGLIRDQVQLPADKPILVKPNMVSPVNSLAATPPEAVRAVLDFLQSLGARRFIIGEATAMPDGDTMLAFQNHGYMPLADKYDLEFRDLNKDDTVQIEALDPDLQPVWIRLARTYFETYVVSVARMKSHAQIIATLSIKNTAIGSIHNPDRNSWAWQPPALGRFSHDPRPLNLNLVRLNQTINPDLAIVDGVVGMEGEGPVAGTPIHSGVALASTDPLAVDLIGTGVMGFDWRTIGYLWYLSQIRGLTPRDVEVRGEDPANCVTPYQAHSKLAWQLGWWVENWKAYLPGCYMKEPRPQTASRTEVPSS